MSSCGREYDPCDDSPRDDSLRDDPYGDDSRADGDEPRPKLFDEERDSDVLGEVRFQ
jgi:hypothetical protein